MPARTYSVPEPDGTRVSYRTTLGWSLVSSGLVTLLLVVLPFPSWAWGVALLVAGVAVLLVRRGR